MRVLLEEVVLDFPGVVDAEAIGELDLVESFVEEALFVAFAPGAWKLMLVEDAELHLTTSLAQRGVSWQKD